MDQFQSSSTCKTMAARMIFLLMLMSAGFLSAQDYDEHNLSCESFYKGIKGRRVVIIDSRTTEERKRIGYIENSIHINFFDHDMQERLANLDPRKKYYLYCRVGSRSSKMMEMMQELGFKHVCHLKGGTNEWVKQGYPVVKDKTDE